MFPDKDDDYTMLADEVKHYLKRFCYLDSESKYDIATLWIFHTHVRTSDDKLAFAETPRLAILSDLPASGKTRLLELVESLSFQGQRVLDPSPAGLLCAIEEDNATVLLDEIDLYFGRNGKQSARSIINAGYRVGNFVRHANAKRDTFAPMAMAGMGQNFMTNQNLAATKSRSIIIRMDKRPDGEVIESYRALVQKPFANRLADVISYWGRKYANDLSLAMPDLPNGVGDRDADIWSPLLAVGELLGGHWADNARNACAKSVLSESSSNERPMSPTERLLHDLVKVVNLEDTNITTATMLKGLESVNPSWGRHINVRSAAMELSATLRPLGVEPVKVWCVESQTSKQGYRVDSIADHLPTSDLPSVEHEDDDVDSLPI